jgi:hypothetical protein
MASMDHLGLLINSGSGLCWFGFFTYAYVIYDWGYYDLVYGSLIGFVDGCRLASA